MATYLLDAGPDDQALLATNTGAAANPVLNGGSAVYKPAMAIQGGFGALFTNVAGQIAIQRFTPGESGNVINFAVGVTLPSTAAPAEREVFWTARTASGVPQIGRSTTGAITLTDTAGANPVTLLAAASVTTTKYLIIGWLNRTTGAYDIDVRAGTGAYGVLNNVAAASGYALGAADYTAVDVGRVAGVATARGYGIDYVIINIGTTATKPSVPSAGSAPSVNAGVDQYKDEGDTATLDATVSGSGTVTSLWTVVEQPVGAPTPSFASATSVDTSVANLKHGRYIFRLTSTNSVGSTSDDIGIWVAPAAGGAMKVYSVTTTTWTNDGGAASILTAINDGVDGTRALSPADPLSTQKMRLVMCPGKPGALSFFPKSLYLDGPILRNVKVYKEDGTTLIFEDDWALTPAAATHEIQLDSTALALVPDRVTMRALVVDIADRNA